MIYLPLSEIANVFRGEYITKKSTCEGDIPVILGGQEPAYYIDRTNHDGEIVVVARSGASAGFVSYWNQGVIEKMKAFFEKYFGLGIAEFKAEEKSVIYEFEPTYMMVAEESAPHGKTDE